MLPLFALVVTLLQSTTCRDLAITPVQPARSANTRTISSPSGDIYVSTIPLVDQRNVIKAYVNIAEGQVVLNVNMDSLGRHALAQFTAAHVGATIAFLYDGHLVRAARILDPLRSGNFLIGPLATTEAHHLAKAINQSVTSCANHVG